MKVFVFAILVASATAAGSGPYLPSGWKPKGPAFNLPGEIEKPSQNLLKDQLFDVEASGSDFLREYGPPKLDVSQDITLQGLPEVDTEKTFFVAKAVDLRADDGVTIENAEINAEEAAVVNENEKIIEETTNTAEYSTIDDETLKVEEAPLVVSEKDSEKQITIEEEIKTEVNEIKEEIRSEVKQISETVNEEVAIINGEVATINEEVSEVDKVMEEVREEEQIASENLRSDLKTEEEISTQNVPEGFLEYGPPGFREYGPPKEDGNQQEPEKYTLVENNETRRRRFSPKFKITPRKH